MNILELFFVVLIRIYWTLKPRGSDLCLLKRKCALHGVGQGCTFPPFPPSVLSYFSCPFSPFSRLSFPFFRLSSSFSGPSLSFLPPLISFLLSTFSCPLLPCPPTCIMKVFEYFGVNLQTRQWNYEMYMYKQLMKGGMVNKRFSCGNN